MREGEQQWRSRSRFFSFFLLRLSSHLFFFFFSKHPFLRAPPLSDSNGASSGQLRCDLLGSVLARRAPIRGSRKRARLIKVDDGKLSTAAAERADSRQPERFAASCSRSEPCRSHQSQMIPSEGSHRDASDRILGPELRSKAIQRRGRALLLLMRSLFEPPPTPPSLSSLSLSSLSL